MGSLREKLKKENRLEALQRGEYSTEINNHGYEEKQRYAQSLVERVQMRANMIMNQNISIADKMHNSSNQLGNTLKTNTHSANNSEIKMYQEDKNVKKASTNLGYIAKKGFAGLLSGATGLLQARNTELAKNLKEGKEGKSNETIINSLNPTNALISASMKNAKENIDIIKDKDKNILEKGVGIATNTVSNALNAVSPIRQVLNPVEHLMGKMLPDNSSENVLKFNDKISEPSEKLNQKLADEKGLHSKKVQFIGDAGQSVGNMAPSILASAITKNPAIGLAVMGESVKGQTTQEALKRGADLEKAVKIGDTKGMIEVGTEMLTGGVNVFGKGALDEIIEKGIDKKVKNEVLNYIAKKGLDLPEEVVEELISDVLGTAIDKGTIDPNASYSLNDFKDTAITTILSTLAINALTGGYGKNAYNQNKAEIQKNIQNSNLSDESQASLARVAEKNNMSTEEVQNLINNPPNEQVLQNNQQIIQEQSKTAQNGNMGQTEQSIQNYLKNASENGLDVQNKTVKSIYEVTQRRGIVAEYNADVFKDKNGKVDENKNAVWTTDENGNRKILINPNANTETTLQNIMVHELTHDFEGSKEYDALSKLALDKMKTQEGYQEARKDLEGIYSKVYDKNSSEFQTLVDQEAVANFLGENLGNQEFINELVNSQPRTTIQKIYDWVVDKIAKVTGNEKLYWKNVEQKFKNAYNSQNVNSNQDSKYSVETLSDGTIYIRDEQNKFTKSDGTKMTPREVYNSLVGKEIDLGDGDKVFILKRLPGNKDLYKELFTRYPKIFNNINDVKKLNTDVNYNIEELLQNSKNILPNEPDKLNRHQKQGIITFDTRIVNFYDGNNAYNIEFSIAKLQDGRKVAYAKRQFDYDDNLTQKIKADETRSSNSPLDQQPLLNNSIPSSNEDVNTTTKYSMQESEKNSQKDNQGRKLTKEQQEYFKNSIVRDKEGNLKTLYHGTDAEFTVFNYDYLGKNGTANGKGFYLADDINVAKSYTGENQRIIEAYVDIEKPLSIGKTTMSENEYIQFLEEVNKETNGALFADYGDGETIQKGSKQYKGIIEQFREEFNYGGDDVDLVLSVLNSGNISLEDGYRVLKNTIGYDGIIVKTDYKSDNGKTIPYTQYIPLTPEQIKNTNNSKPTSDKDIRFSYQSNGAWNDFLKKHSINKGTGETIQQVKLPQMPIEQFQKVLDNAKHIPQEEKEYLLETVKDIKRNKTSLEDFKKTIETMEKAYDEQNENILDTKKTYNTGRREIYQKYMKAKTEYDTSSLENAKEIIPANKQGRRTKTQWLNIAKQIGTEIADKTNAEIEEIAYRTWQDERPSNKESLNRQGEKFVTFTSDEWINTIYDTVKKQREKYSIDTGENTKVQDENVKEEPKRKIVDEVYKEEINDGKTRKHYKSIFESDQIGKTGKDVAKELYKTDTYTPISNLDTMTEANKNIERNGVEDTYTTFRTKLRTNEKITLQDIATGERLIQIYSQNGDYQKVNDLIQDVAILGTELGQQVQAFSLIKKASPEGQLQYLKKLVARTNIKEDTDIKVTEDMTKKILESKNENELEKNMSDVAVEIAEQLPISRRDKIRSWRYLSMLGNPKTHIKNVGANVFMNLTQSAKNIVAGGVEDVVGTFNKNLEKTKTLKPANKEQKNFAKQDAEYMQDLIDGGGKFDVENIIQNNKKQFDNKMLNKIAEFNSDMLDVEDKIFLKLAYKQAMQNYMSANKLKANDMQGKILEKARQYASIQAQEATFHQFNALANTLNQVENRGGFFGKAVEATLPFKKTPMNIAKEGLEYSPVGLAKSVTYDLGQLATKTKAYKKQLKEGKITQEQYKAETSKLATKTIDNFAKGFTGSSIAVLGYFLSQAGILKAGNDGDDDEFKESLGEQEYAIKIGDNTYTLDWISPSAIPLFTGATIQQLRNGEIRADGSLINSTMTGLAKSFEPMTEMSMLQGLTSAISSYEKGSNMFFDLLSSMTTSYLGQFVPTVSGQIARTIDPYERDTSTTKKGIESKADRFLKQTMNKIPGISQKLPVKKDVWGNDKKRANNVGVRLLENAILPFNRKELIEDRTDKELLKVFDETGEKILPSAPSKDLTINKQKYRMTSKEYNDARKTFGQTSKKLLDDLFSSKDYLSLSSEGRAKAIQDVYSYAKEELKKQYANSKGQELKTSKLYNTVSELKEQKGNVSSYFEFKGKLDDLDRANGEESLKDKQKLEYLGKLKENDSTKRIIYEDTFGTKDKVYNGLKKLTNNAVSINDYLNYKISDFSADKEDDGTLNGKTISGSAKQKVVDFINNSNFSDIEKLYLRGTKNKLDTSQRNQFAEYIDTLNLSDEDIKAIYLTLNGVVEMSDGTIKWK